ncbi:hypothetical protein L9G16_21395, partial [Shewanella sp. A25]|nr:hypothetical protein [Shewanella shenzhenensis]
MPTVDYYRAQDMMMEWGPRVLIAVVIMRAAHMLAKMVQWGLARVIDRSPGLNTLYEGVEPKVTVGYQV